MLHLLLLLLCPAHVFAISKVANAFITSQLLPDIIHRVPYDPLKVRYGGTWTNFGDLKTVAQVKDEPKLWWKAYPFSFYTVVMVDPDALSRTNPVMREWRHWMVVNVPGTRIQKGDVVTKYEGSDPPPGSGPHRYAILVYRQKGRFNPKRLGINNENRANFHIEQFVKKHKYHHSWPDAGSYFEVEADK